MATREALAIRREAAFARIVAAVGAEPPTAHRDPDVTLTQFVEWTAEQFEARAEPVKSGKAKSGKAKSGKAKSEKGS